MKTLALLLLAATMFAQDKPAAVNKLTDAQKLAVARMQLKFFVAQDAAQRANADMRDVQKSLAELSTQACGANAHIDLGKTANDEPTCAPNTPDKSQ